MSKAIHIDGKEYSYKVFRSGAEVRTPENKRVFIQMTELTGMDWDSLERAHWKGYWPAAKPSDVKRCLKRMIEKV